MDRAELSAALAKALDESRARYEAERENAYLSHVYAAEAETLEALCRRAAEGLSAEELARQAREEVPALEELVRQEDEHPSFSWYGEHYYSLCYEGQCDAWRTVQRLLEGCAAPEGQSAGEAPDGGLPEGGR